MGILDGIVEWIAEQIMYGLDMINTSVLGALGCDMNTFLRYFPAAETMYSLLVALAIGLILLGWVWNLFKNYGLGLGVDAEDPVKLTAKAILFIVLAYYADEIVNIALTIGGTPYTNPSGIMELPDDDPSEYHSLYEALAANGISTEGLPTWVPRDYAILSVTAKSSDGVIKCVAVYESNRGNIVIRALKIISPDITVAEERDTDAISYQHNQEEFFIVSDRQWMKADWENEGIFFSISGQISEDEINRESV